MSHRNYDHSGPGDPATTVREADAPSSTVGTVVAVLSMLHESADRNSATRAFRGAPVLAWTLKRLASADRVGGVAVLC